MFCRVGSLPFPEGGGEERKFSSGVGIGQLLGANRFELLTDIGGERFAESQSMRCDTARILFHGTHVGAYEAEPVCEEGVFDDVHAAARALRFFTERHSLSDKAEVIECLQVQVNIAVLDSGMLRDYLGRRFAVCNGLHHRKNRLQARATPRATASSVPRTVCRVCRSRG